MRAIPRMFRLVAAMAVAVLLFGCVAEEGGASGSGGGGQQPAPRQQAEGPRTAKLDASQAERLKRVMTPLIQKMDNPIRQVRITLWDDPHINAANGGGGDFYVTTGLLKRANDDQLRAILAHEIAHADMGHVAEATNLAAGLGIASILLDQIVPGSGNITPIAGQLVTSAYGRKDEHEADTHGVTLMRRAGYDGKTLMANTLEWLTKTEGDTGGGFFATHPATGDRIRAIREMP
jgi:predicted Zn-dependent protease